MYITPLTELYTAREKVKLELERCHCECKLHTLVREMLECVERVSEWKKEYIAGLPPDNIYRRLYEDARAMNRKDGEQS